MSRVLLVEDVPAVRITLQKFLERGGHLVTTSEGGEDAWSQTRSTRFDVIVTDLWMMSGDGPGLIQRLRSAGDATPVIAITGGDPRSPVSTSADLALRAGADRALLKPVTKALLLDTVAECVKAEPSLNERTA